MTARKSVWSYSCRLRTEWVFSTFDPGIVSDYQWYSPALRKNCNCNNVILGTTEVKPSTKRSILDQGRVAAILQLPLGAWSITWKMAIICCCVSNLNQESKSLFNNFLFSMAALQVNTKLSVFCLCSQSGDLATPQLALNQCLWPVLQ